MLQPIVCPPGWRIVVDGAVDEGDRLVMLHDDKVHEARRHLAGMSVIHFRAVMRRIPAWVDDEIDETPLESEVLLTPGPETFVDLGGEA